MVRHIINLPSHLSRSVSHCRPDPLSHPPTLSLILILLSTCRHSVGLTLLGSARLDLTGLDLDSTSHPCSYPLWRSAAIGQSGFRVASMTVGGLHVPHALAPYVYGFMPPYKGMVAVVVGMTWARAAIFWTSDYGREVMRAHGYSDAAATVVPPLVMSTFVQVVNQPIVRSTVTLQDPNYHLRNVVQACRHIYSEHGVTGLWHGTSAGVLKTVPKYITAIAVKDYMEEVLAQPNPNSSTVRFHGFVARLSERSMYGNH